MTEYTVPATEMRLFLGHAIMAATWGDSRFIITRHGKVIAAIVGIADLQYLRDRDGDVLKYPPPPPPAPAPEWSLEWLREIYRSGQITPPAHTAEQQAVQWELAAEIGAKVIRGQDPRA